jgi:hypothetical protein
MLELMPDGETFQKLTKAQHNALDRYYKRQKPSLIDETAAPLIANGVPIVVGTAIGAIAYVFRDQLADEAKDFAGGVGKFVNEGIWSSLIFPVLDPLWKDPKTTEYVLLNPEADIRDYTYAGPLTRCQRWETDIVDIEARETGGGGIDRAFVLRKMKNEGCSKPAFVEAGEWGRV